MSGPAIDKIARHLEAVLVKARRKAIVSSLLAVLCTPMFVALVSLAVGVMLFSAVQQPGHWTDAFTIYTGMIVFLGFMLALVLMDSRDSLMRAQFTKTWLTAAGIFALLLVLTYRTSLPAQTPGIFKMLFALGGLLVLGIIGQVPLASHVTWGSGTCKDIFIGLVAVCGFIVTAYGELLSASWLWVRPHPQDVRIAANVLYRLAIDPDEPFDSSTVDKRVMTLLFRLKLVKMNGNELHLTPKGMDFVWATAEK